VIKNLTLQGARLSTGLGANGAGIRENAAGEPWTADSVEITGCDDGILSSGSNVTLSNGYTHDNGSPINPGYTHEIYLDGSPTTTVTLTNWVSTCGQYSTHALKIRAGTAEISGGTYTGSSDSTGTIGGSVIDFPQGGNFTMNNATIIVAKGAANNLFFGFGMENALNASTGDTATFNQVVFNDENGTGGIIANGTYFPNAKLVLNGCTYTGKAPPVIQGFLAANVFGTITKAA